MNARLRQPATAAAARDRRTIGRPGRPVRVLVADDSALMRHQLRRLLEADDDIVVVDTARDGLDALLKTERLQPDVITMDVEMPRLSGLEAVRLLMERFPRPVVMLSSQTSAGAETTVRALALGAIDFVAKPLGLGDQGLSAIADELVGKVKRAASARVRRPLPAARQNEPGRPRPAQRSGPAAEKLLVIGASTGGPRALAELFAGLPDRLPCAIVVVQHLPAGFTRSLAERLDQCSAVSVAEAQAGDVLAPGRALLAPGDFHLRLTSRRISLEQGPRQHGVRPSVDTTLEDAAEHFGPAVLAVILTGMGVDGTAGCHAVKARGGLVFSESESSCVVYGMPRAVVQAGLSDRVVPLDRLAPAIVRAIAALPTRSAGQPGHA